MKFASGNAACDPVGTKIRIRGIRSLTQPKAVGVASERQYSATGGEVHVPIPWGGINQRRNAKRGNSYTSVINSWKSKHSFS